VDHKGGKERTLDDSSIRERKKKGKDGAPPIDTQREGPGRSFLSLRKKKEKGTEGRVQSGYLFVQKPRPKKRGRCGLSVPKLRKKRKKKGKEKRTLSSPIK